jgi:hypothetical protein
MNQMLVQTHKIVSILGIIFGGVICIIGVLVMILGLSGSIEFMINVGGIVSRLINASPGVLIFFLGIFIMAWVKSRIRYEYEIRQTPNTYYEKGSGSA